MLAEAGTTSTDTAAGGSTSTSTDAPDESATFASLGLAEPLCEACASMGFKKPSAIQREAIPWALGGRDIIGLAETGSGKTAAFGLPILHSLLAKPQPLCALVVAPTRELAFQIGEQFEALGSVIGVKCAVAVGGVDMVQQAILLAKRPHVLVGTPGRLVDHLQNTKGFSIRALRFLVLDEADKLLNMDFEKELDIILQAAPREGRSTFLFSATMTSKVEKLQRASLTNPVKVEVSSKYQTVKTLVQQYLFIPAKHKDCYLAYVCNELAGHTTIIFCATCASCQRIALLLRALGFPAVPLHGQLSQPKRLAALNKFKAGERSILIATDVASRGIDIPSVDLVLNYEYRIPGDIAAAPRAGRAGLAVGCSGTYRARGAAGGCRSACSRSATPRWSSEARTRAAGRADAAAAAATRVATPTPTPSCADDEAEDAGAARRRRRRRRGKKQGGSRIEIFP